MLKIKVFDELKVMADELRKMYKIEQKMNPDDPKFNSIRQKREELERDLNIKLKDYQSIIETAISFEVTEKFFHPHHPTQ